jgi:Immunoglobulin domain
MLRRSLTFLALAALAPTLFAQITYNDGHGREWRQVKETTILSWNQVAGVCPQDGQTPCNGVVGGKDLSGWIWATREQVTDLFSYFTPDILVSPSISGPGYVLPALDFVGKILPTFAYYTSFGAYESVAGWTATSYPNGMGGRAFVAGEYPVFDGVFDVAIQADPADVSAYVGVWLFKPVDCGISIQGGGGSVTPCRGSTLELSVTASGPGPFTHEWRKNGEPLVDGPTPGGSIIAGAATPALEISNVSSADAGAYQCVVSNTCGSLGSDATLAGVCDGDCDCDGTLGIDDFICFQTLFAIGEPAADCDANGQLAIDDFICFQTAFALGC